MFGVCKYYIVEIKCVKLGKSTKKKKVWKKVMIELAWGELIQSKMTRKMTSRKTFAVISSSQLQISKESLLSA